MAKTREISTVSMVFRPAPSDLNDITESGIYTTDRELLNSPASRIAGSVITYVSSHAAGIMTLWNLQEGGQLYVRIRAYNGLWQDWHKATMTRAPSVATA